MNEQTIELLRDFAAQIGTSVEYLMVVLVRQAYIQGIINLCWTVAAIGAVIWLWPRARRCFAAGVETGWEEPEPTIGVLALFSVIAFLLITAGINLENGIVALLNPEYWAIDRIFQSVGER